MSFGGSGLVSGEGKSRYEVLKREDNVRVGDTDWLELCRRSLPMVSTLSIFKRLKGGIEGQVRDQMEHRSDSDCCNA